MKLLFIVNVDWFFDSHRLPIALEALRLGHEVHIATTYTTHRNQFASLGFIVHDLYFQRNGSNILSLLSSTLNILRVYLKVKPDIVHLISILPVLLGGSILGFFDSAKLVFSVSGLGHTFIDKTLFGRLRKFVVCFVYRLALRSASGRIIVQNITDQNIISSLSGVDKNAITVLPGSGVDLSLYSPSMIKDSPPSVIMASRLLKTKGVYEYLEAVRILQEREVVATFYLAGSLDSSNPASLTQKDINLIFSRSAVKFLGFRSDLYNIFPKSSIVVLPSYLEGFPKVLCEASACGCAIVTTDVPGCRDAVVPSVTGLLVPPRDSDSLANSIHFLLNNPSILDSMTLSSRSHAMKYFDIKSIVFSHINLYNQLFAAESSTF